MPGEPARLPAKTRRESAANGRGSLRTRRVHPRVGATRGLNGGRNGQPRPHPFTLTRDGFTYSWTLSSKFFSTFPHGTCSLSDSRRLVFSLRWSLPPGFGLHYQTTRLWGVRGASEDVGRLYGSFTLYGRKSASFTRTRTPHTPGRMRTPTHHISARPARDGRFGAGLFPIRSPLLRESLLVSFPPLSDMLKFSGYSRLTSGRKVITINNTPRTLRPAQALGEGA